MYILRNFNSSTLIMYLPTLSATTVGVLFSILNTAKSFLAEYILALDTSSV